MRTSIAAVVLALSLAGCTPGQGHPGPEVKVADGTLDSGGWTAWTYQSTSEGTCLEIRPADLNPASLCGLDGSNTGIWQPDTPGTNGTFLAGTIANQGAVSARIALVDGREVRAAITPGTGVTNLGFFVIVLEPEAWPAQLDVFDGTGAVLDSLALPGGPGHS